MGYCDNPWDAVRVNQFNGGEMDGVLYVFDIQGSFG